MNGNQDNLEGSAQMPSEPSLNQNPTPPQPPQVVPTPPSTPVTPSSTSVPPFGVPKSSSVGAPPPPDIGIRTMASDLSSLKSSGGLESKPKTFRPEDFSTEAIFQPAEAGAAETGEPSAPHKPLYIILGIVGFVIIASLVIYFFIWPLIKSPSNQTPVDNNPPDDTTPTTSGTLIHTSFFTAQTASTVLANLSNLNLAEIASVLSTSSAGLSQGSLTEINLTVNNTPPESSDFLTTVFPQLDKTILTNNLERDFTVFVYRDANGSWPGYVFKVSSGGAMDAVATPLRNIIEPSTNLGELFLTDPGKQIAGGFKDGLQVAGSTARYASFASAGASVNYGWFNNYLIISTSFNGFKESLKALGLSS